MIQKKLTGTLGFPPTFQKVSQAFCLKRNTNVLQYHQGEQFLMTTNQASSDESGVPQCALTHTHEEKSLFHLESDMIKIRKELGKGAFSVVYVGEYRNQAVAVKCQPKDEDGNVPAFVCKEINALQRFKHPRVLNFIGAADSKKTKQIWIVSEKLGQSDLDQLLKNIRSSTIRHIGWRKLLQIALDIAEGINYLHSMRCIHRDIKPHNVLVGRSFIGPGRTTILIVFLYAVG